MVTSALCAVLIAINIHAPLELLNAYEQPPGTCTLVVTNTLPVPLSTGGVTASLETIWITIQPQAIEHSQRALIRYRLSETAAQQPIPGHDLLVGDHRLHIPAPARPPLLVTYAVYESSTETLHFYLRNNSSRIQIISRICIDASPASIPPALRLSPGTCHHIQTQHTGSTATKWPASAWFDITADSGVHTFLVPIFLPEHTVHPAKNPDMDAISCLTHEFPDPKTAATTAMTAIAHAGPLATIKFCNHDLKEGPALFAPLANRNHIEPLLANNDYCHLHESVTPILDACAANKASTAPGIYYALIHPEDIHHAKHALFPLHKVRNAAYACLAEGSKGVSVVPIAHQDPPPDYANALTNLQQEFDALHPFIALSEPAPLASSDPALLLAEHTVTGFADIAVRTLLGARQGILLMLLPLQDAPAPDPRSVFILSPYPLEGTALEVGGREDTLPLQRTPEGLYRVTIEHVTQARVFYLPSATTGPPP